MNYCYIIYSTKIDKYYIGETENFEKRLLEHNSGFFKNAYTKQATDWEKYLVIKCINRAQARKMENFIKKMKSKVFIIKLKENPNMVNEILSKFDLE